MNKLLKIMAYTAWFWLFLVLLSVMNINDPVSAGPGGILLVFIITYLMIVSLLFVMLHWGVGFVSAQIVKRGRSVNARAYRVGVRKSYYIASVVAFGPVLLLALNSVRQLQATDVLLVVALICLAIFYFIKRNF